MRGWLVTQKCIYLFKLLFICSYTTTFWAYRKSSSSVLHRYKSTRWQCTCCNVLIPFKSIKEELPGLSFLAGGVYSDLPLEWLLLFCTRACGSMYSPACCVCFTWFFFFFLNLGFNKTKQAELVPKEIWVLHPAWKETWFLCICSAVYWEMYINSPRNIYVFLYIDNISSCYFSSINSDMEIDRSF